jgi:hypothetical protein
MQGRGAAQQTCQLVRLRRSLEKLHQGISKSAGDNNKPALAVELELCSMLSFVSHMDSTLE